MKRYSWLFFDLDMTIFDFETSSKFALKDVFHELGLQDEQATYDKYYEVNHKVWKELEDGVISAEELKAKRWQLFIDQYNIKANAKELNTYYLDCLVDYTIVIPGAFELLRELKEVYSLCAATNGLEQVQKRRLIKAGMQNIFDQVIISEEIGVAKPHKSFFKIARGKIENPAKRDILMIGDSLHSDVKGAQNAEIDSCWFNPKGLEMTLKKPPTYEIQSFAELEKLLVF